VLGRPGFGLLDRVPRSELYGVCGAEYRSGREKLTARRVRRDGSVDNAASATKRVPASEAYQKRKTASIMTSNRSVRHAADPRISTVVTARGGLDNASMRRSIGSIGSLPLGPAFARELCEDEALFCGDALERTRFDGREALPYGIRVRRLESRAHDPRGRWLRLSLTLRSHGQGLASSNAGCDTVDRRRTRRIR
jgi:hypothetical protein